MKAYPAYKDSGIEWIGEIPEHWIIKKFKYWFDLITEKDDSENKKIGLENIESQTGRFINTKSDFQGDGILFRENDILFGKLRPYLAKVYLADFSGSAVGDFFVFRAKKDVASSFAFHRILSTPFIEITNSSTYGAKMPRVNWEFISNLDMAFPSKTEQTTIANFLDHKTAQIDLSIARQRTLIELLQEHRAAIINEAVTKGINPDVPMKDSGIEWIGEIPAHWEVKALKWLIREPLKYGANEPAQDENHENPRYIRITDFGNDGKLRDSTFKSLPFSIAKDYLLEEGDILFARSGATVGKTFQFSDYEGLACYAGYLIKASPDRDKVLSDYLYFYTKSGAYENWKNSIFIQATIQNIGADKYKVLPVSLPKKEEQQQIVQYIETETTRIDQEIAATQKEIELLEEYRQSLIAEAVTGKIDVRDYVLGE